MTENMNAWREPLEPDMFTEMWQQQKDFMLLLQEKRGQVKFPVDMETKAGQRIVKEYLHECVEESFEAIQALKNSKSHRNTEIKGFDRKHFLEECVDAQHYLWESVIFAGFMPEEFYDAYMKKGFVNFERISSGY